MMVSFEKEKILIEIYEDFLGEFENELQFLLLFPRWPLNAKPDSLMFTSIKLNIKQFESIVCCQLHRPHTKCQ